MMQHLHLLPSSGSDLELASIEGDFETPIRRYIFSTPQTSAIVNRPEVMGVEYTEKLEEGITMFLESFRPMLGQVNDRDVNVLHFLRGGLNFGIREALGRAYGWNLQGSTYISSQRDKDEMGRWYIREDSYRKSTIRKGSIIFCGDVVATGVTMESGLRTLTKIVKEEHASIRRFIFFTIGCHKAEKVLQHFHDVWKEHFPDFEGIDVIYIEGKFHLADSKTPVTIKLQGTDLLRRDSILLPSFIQRQEASLSAALERCTIYDAGSRAFDIAEYCKDVAEYWAEVAALAEKGMSAQQYLQERYPEAGQPLLQAAQHTDLGALARGRTSLFS